MRLLDRFRRSQPRDAIVEQPNVLTKEQKTNKEVAIAKHQKLVTSLNEERAIIQRELERLEFNLDLTKNEKSDESNRMISRLVMLRYEVEIREGLIDGLNSKGD